MMKCAPTYTAITPTKKPPDLANEGFELLTYEIGSGILSSAANVARALVAQGIERKVADL